LQCVVAWVVLTFSGMRKVKSADAFIVWLCEAFSCVKLC
jgi:hypothetical protein